MRFFPPFDKNASGTDWNDFMKQNGKEQTSFLFDMAIGRTKALWEVTREAKDRVKARQEATRSKNRDVVDLVQKQELEPVGGRYFSR
jgi:hypothetical protein